MNVLQSKLLFPFLRFFFKHLYTTLAWSYDLVANLSSMGQWWTWCRTVLPETGTQPVLELGHGTGRLILDAYQSGVSPYAIDSSRQMGQITARRIQQSGHKKLIAQARAQALPFPDGYFKLVYATFPSDYIFDRLTLEEAYRVLDGDGRLLVVGVANITGKSLPDRIAKALYRFTGQAGEPGREWRQPLTKAGFEPTLERIQLPRAEVLHFIGHKA